MWFVRNCDVLAEGARGNEIGEFFNRKVIKKLAFWILLAKTYKK